MSRRPNPPNIIGVSVGSVNPTATLPERYTTYGREYLIGFNYRL
ncbi:MAG TPA: hypothetical protein VK624_00775 [Steroidobacteraceae bacterium]|nr:hypothetical protein [Steroidobacteraceae bacterium]